MASTMDTATFFSKGTPEQFEFVLSLYTEAVKLKAERKNKKPEELIRLDSWYQNELPKKIKSRGKDRHLIHEELVQTMKWKLARGKFYPQLSYLIKVNTPKAVISETRRAFRKLPNLEQAITALSNLKGVGTTMASALCAAAAPEEAPFMADECLMAIPDFEGIDYTTKEYLNFVQHIRTVVERLNKEAQNPEAWNPHRVEMALWSHYVVTESKPELLEAEPPKNGNSHHLTSENGVSATKPEEGISDDSTQDTSSKDSPAPPAILSPEDSLLEPPTEDSMDAGTVEDESSRECSQPAHEPSEEAAEPSPSTAAAAPAEATEVAEEAITAEPAKEPVSPPQVSEQTTEAEGDVEPATKRVKVDA